MREPDTRCEETAIRAPAAETNECGAVICGHGRCSPLRAPRPGASKAGGLALRRASGAARRRLD